MSIPSFPALKLYAQRFCSKSNPCFSRRAGAGGVGVVLTITTLFQWSQIKASRNNRGTA